MTSDIEYTSWRKASYSNGSGACLETASGSGTVAVRDTTDRGGIASGTSTLTIPAAAWAKFTASLKG
jgi:Domain of unknown function (DUF397)